MKKFIADLFKGVGNIGWDLGRCASAWAIVSTSGIAIYQLIMGQTVTLSEYAQSMMTVFGGSTFFIAGKDIARAHAESKSADVPPAA